MKKYLAVLISMMLILTGCLVGCSSGTDSSSTDSSDSTTTTSTASDSGVTKDDLGYEITKSGTYTVPDDIIAGTYDLEVSGDVTFNVTGSNVDDADIQSGEVSSDTTNEVEYTLVLRDGNQLEVTLGENATFALVADNGSDM